MEHVLIAERAMGKPLPAKAEVHHVDESKGNNVPSNLVICQDHAYHRLLHVRMRALDACGNANWRKCTFCKRYDDPAAMTANRWSFYHAACHATYQCTRYQRERTRNAA